MNECQNCKKAGDTDSGEDKLRLCSGCNAVYYCSVNCQKEDRKAHREFCNEKKLLRYATPFDHSGLVKFTSETPVKPEALKKLEHFARQGQVQGQQILADYYYLGKGVERDYAKALEFSEMAAKQENIEGIYYLGRYYFEGLAVKQDFKKAFGYLKIAAALGQPDALLPLSQCYEYGLGCKADMKLAFEMTEKAAKDDHPSGQFRMGQFLQRGLGCEVNEMESKKWLNRAAKQHHRFAIEALKKE